VFLGQLQFVLEVLHLGPPVQLSLIPGFLQLVLLVQSALWLEHQVAELELYCINVVEMLWMVVVQVEALISEAGLVLSLEVSLSVQVLEQCHPHLVAWTCHLVMQLEDPETLFCEVVRAQAPRGLSA